MHAQARSSLTAQPVRCATSSHQRAEKSTYPHRQTLIEVARHRRPTHCRCHSVACVHIYTLLYGFTILRHRSPDQVASTQAAVSEYRRRPLREAMSSLGALECFSALLVSRYCLARIIVAPVAIFRDGSSTRHYPLEISVSIYIFPQLRIIMSYNVYTAEYHGSPNHVAIFVEIQGDKEGRLFNVTGNILEGMKYETRPSSNPTQSLSYVPGTMTLIGTIK